MNRALGVRGPSRETMIVVVFRLVSWVSTLAYPFLVYAAFRYPQSRFVLLGVIVVFIVAAIGSRIRKQNGRPLAWIPVLSAGFLLVALLFRRHGLALAVPVVINLAFLGVFGSTLLRSSGPPMIERFARLQEPDLSPPKVSWCRLWTLIWCVYFLVNALTSFSLALWGSLSSWTFYTGGVAYALMGVLFALEWILRRYRFSPRYSEGS